MQQEQQEWFCSSTLENGRFAVTFPRRISLSEAKFVKEMLGMAIEQVDELAALFVTFRDIDNREVLIDFKASMGRIMKMLDEIGSAANVKSE